VGMAEVVESLTSKYDALSSNPNPTKKPFYILSELFYA
jgi:hypothetical protein